MDYLQTAAAIQAVIERRPGDAEAYRDLFSLCRSWGETDEQAAHQHNRGLRLLCSQKIGQVDARTRGQLYEVWRKSLLYDAPVDFDSYMLYVELDRKPDKRFYQPRRHYLRPMVQGFQDILDGKLRLLTIGSLMGQALFCCSANNWWERSPNGSNTTNFCNVNSSGNANNNNASNSNGVSFGLCNSHRSDVVTPLGEISTFCRGRACSQPKG